MSLTNQDQKKQTVAKAALNYVEENAIVGVGTGSTVNFFIEELANSNIDIQGAVSSSQASTELLKSKRIHVMELNQTNEISVYIDGADECDPHKRLIKGGGGALTREKIVAAASNQFICIIDDSKQVDILGKFPLPIEVIPMAQNYVARELVKIGGQPQLRENFITDNGNIIIDVYNLKIIDPVNMEKTLNNIAGIVTVGLFAQKPAGVVLVAKDSLEIIVKN